MSWTPTFWLHKTDFDKVKTKLVEADETDQTEFFPFTIVNYQGMVIISGETTHQHRITHDILKEARVPHWILNGEGEGCKWCLDWGESIDKDAIRGGYDG